MKDTVDASEGYYIQPTVIVTQDPRSATMVNELFGPVVTVHVYPDAEYEHTLKLADETSPYALTGALFARDREAIIKGSYMLRNAAGNFYINDKSTGAVVGRALISSLLAGPCTVTEMMNRTTSLWWCKSLRNQ